MLISRKIKLTKKFTFDMAHALYGHDGQCKNIHGHTYHLEITVEGLPLNRPGFTDDGMVMDFSDMKKIVHDAIVKKLDHALVLNQNAPYSDNKDFLNQFEKVVILPFQPTCENLVLYFADALECAFVANIKLYSIRLDETPTSYAVWTND